MRKLTPAENKALAAYADRNPSDPFARGRAINRLVTGHVNANDLAAGRLDSAPSVKLEDEQYIVRDLETFHAGRGA